MSNALTLDEPQLVARLRAGEQSAFEQLVRSNSGKLLATARRGAERVHSRLSVAVALSRGVAPLDVAAPDSGERGADAPSVEKRQRRVDRGPSAVVRRGWPSGARDGRLERRRGQGARARRNG